MKKKYTILGDNNFWYATTGEITNEELNDILKEIKEGIDNNEYEHGSKPTLLYVHEVGEISYQVEL